MVDAVIVENGPTSSSAVSWPAIFAGVVVAGLIAAEGSKARDD